MMKYNHQRVCELKGNQQCQDHAEQRLERLRVPWIEEAAPYHRHGMKDQLPGCDGHDHGDDPGQNGDNHLLEPLIAMTVLTRWQPFREITSLRNA